MPYSQACLKNSSPLPLRLAPGQREIMSEPGAVATGHMASDWWTCAPLDHRLSFAHSAPIPPLPLLNR